MLFKKNTLKKEIRNADELLRLARKVKAYRKDVISQNDLVELDAAASELENTRNNAKTAIVDFKNPFERLDKILKKCGGTMYPVTFWNDNCEVFLVALILAIGIRTFFLQPFSIPTNSMYPTYNGMTSQVFQSAAEVPSTLNRIWRKITLLSTHYDLKTKKGGKLEIPLFNLRDPLVAQGIIRFAKVTGTKWFILPTPVREYTFFVDGEPSKIRVPWDFNLDDVVQKTYFKDHEEFIDVIKAKFQSYLGGASISAEGPSLAVDKTFEPNESILNFDILTGDMLFVDRFSYHFKKPKIGEAIVFTGEMVEGLQNSDGANKYLIKHLVGIGGDTLEVQPPMLLRNDKPIEGIEAFKLNFDKVGEYQGYTARGELSLGKKVHIPEGYVYGMGDNSAHSGDSRNFGPIPEKALMGKALFIFYPFTHRWGIAK